MSKYEKKKKLQWNGTIKLTCYFLNENKWTFKYVEISIKAKFFRLSHDVVTCDVDSDVSTAHC